MCLCAYLHFLYRIVDDSHLFCTYEYSQAFYANYDVNIENEITHQLFTYSTIRNWSSLLDLVKMRHTNNKNEIIILFNIFFQ